MLKRWTSHTPEFTRALDALSDRGEADFSRVESIVREVIAEVRKRGDAAVLDYTQRWDKRRPEVLLRRDYPGAAALERLAPAARDALAFAAARITRFHEHEKDAGFSYYEENGMRLGLRVSPVSRAGVYAPGGKARYPSSVLMSAIPARVAGVKDIVLTTPLAGDASDDVMYAAAHLSGVTAIVDAGGAQAIAALAYGTETIPRCDKIVGPGNAYVACAKRLVFGAVSIDSIAGPSEILVLCDDSATPAHVAADLLSQAEHDEAAYPLLVAPTASFVDAVERALEEQLATLPRAAVARASLTDHGHAFIVGSREETARVADRLAVEHVAFHVRDAEALLESVGACGAAFLGPLTPEAAGDYLAGPSHVLPTGGAVRFGAPLGVYDFVRKTSILRYSQAALSAHASAITTLARLEGLEGHARAVEVRLAALSEAPVSGSDGVRKA
jgi:histidinol dehydrogenase